MHNNQFRTVKNIKKGGITSLSPPFFIFFKSNYLAAGAAVAGIPNFVLTSVVKSSPPAK